MKGGRMAGTMSVLSDTKRRQTDEREEIKKLAKKRKLSKEEKERLIEYCITHEIPNVHHVIHDPQSIADIL